jgi:transposase-like protein
LIAKYKRRFPGFDEKIVSMYARGMSVREIQGHIRELYGIDVSPDLVSAVTDAVLEEEALWQNRPLGRSIPWCSSTPCGSKSAMRAWCATRPSMWHSASGRTKPRKS